MAKYYYPAILEPDESGMYSIIFPDLPYGASCGKNLADALFMASDFLATVMCELEDSDIAVPNSSSPDSINHTDNQIVSLIPCDTVAYREEHDKRLVNKTVTIEAWLNRMAEKAHLNCSRLLRNAIKAELNIK